MRFSPSLVSFSAGLLWWSLGTRNVFRSVKSLCISYIETDILHMGILQNCLVVILRNRSINIIAIYIWRKCQFTAWIGAAPSPKSLAGHPPSDFTDDDEVVETLKSAEVKVECYSLVSNPFVLLIITIVVWSAKGKASSSRTQTLPIRKTHQREYHRTRVTYCSGRFR